MSFTSATTQASEAPTNLSSSAPTDDANYIMSNFSTLLEGDLYDDELNGKHLVILNKNIVFWPTDIRWIFFCYLI